MSTPVAMAESIICGSVQRAGLPLMAYEKPTSSLNQIDRAGKRYFDTSLSTEERGEAIVDIWNWRAAHGYPLNALHMTLRNRARKLDADAVTAQRLKRLESILRKLGRESTMQMSQMQDIGGCRAVVADMTRLYMLRFMYEANPIRHDLSRARDYVHEPKDDGYRSLHLMYRFCGRASSLPWDKIRIEIQIRTKLQHAWATAVETVDAFTGQDLKFGSGLPEWRRFFMLMGTVHANIEKSPHVPNTPSNTTELMDEVRHLEHELQVVESLRHYALVTRHITRTRPASRDWYLLEMQPAEGQVLVSGFSKQQFGLAKTRLAKAERKFEGTRNQAALVSASSLIELRKAYPNYFADTTNFTNVLSRFLRRPHAVLV